MRRRVIQSVGVVATLACVSLALATLHGQAPSTTKPAAATKALKTPWGEPNLEGIWTQEYAVPVERPARFANKEFFTDKERADLDKERAAAPHFGDRVAKKGTEADVGGAYNSFWLTQKHTGRRTSLVVDPPDGRIPPLTAEAEKKNEVDRQFRLALMQATEACKNKEATCAGGKYGPPSPKRTEVAPSYSTGNLNRADGPEDRGMGERCMVGALPDFPSAFGGMFRRIVQSPGTVSIFYDSGQGQGFQRIVPITTSPHLPSNVRQWWGDSRGHWEGNTLVVDVTNFSPKSNFRGSNENLHLVERWTMLDANTLEYTVTFHDPTTWARPWTAKQEFGRQSNEANRIYYEPRCHEGNYGMVGLLAGARKAEADFAAGRGPDPATFCIGACGTDPEGATAADPLANR